MRVVAVSTCAVSPFSLRSKVLLSPCRKYLFHHVYAPVPSISARKWQSIGCSMRIHADENDGDSNHLATLLNTVLARGQNITFVDKLKAFPWKKAGSVLAERLLVLGQKALKWSLALLLASSFLLDIFMAAAGNKELLIPFGLFIGVMLADFLKEFSQEFLQSNPQDQPVLMDLLAVGAFFTSIKFLLLCFNVQGRLLISHISNGGLMQVLWLARERQHVANVEKQEEKVLGISSSND